MWQQGRKQAGAPRVLPDAAEARCLRHVARSAAPPSFLLPRLSVTCDAWALAASLGLALASFSSTSLSAKHAAMASAPAAAPPAPGSAFALLSLRPTFTQGLLVGQLSIVVLLLILLRFLLFADPDASPSRRRQRGPISAPSAWPSSARKNAAAPPPPLRSTPRVPPRHLAERAGYDVGAHAPESTDWVNVLLALALHGYREDLAAGNEGGARAAVEHILNAAVEGKTAGTLLVSTGERTPMPARHGHKSSRLLSAPRAEAALSRIASL
jgi:hypothetical protein